MIVGVDVSSYRVDISWLDLAHDGRMRPERWHTILGTPKDHLIDRVRNVYIQWPEGLTEVAIEYPPPRNYATTAALMAVIGAITKSTPKYARVAWPSVREIRNALGSGYSKEQASTRLDEIAHMKGWVIDEWDEHERDALIACMAWTIILNDKENT